MFLELERRSFGLPVKAAGRVAKVAGSLTRNMPEVVGGQCQFCALKQSEVLVCWLTFPFVPCVSPSSKDQAEMDPADMEDVEEVEEEETGEDENSKGWSVYKNAAIQVLMV